MTDRIKIILKSRNLSPSQFADEIDVQRSGISHILSGRNKPSLEFLQKLFSKYPTLNSKWLIMGLGNMIIESGAQSQRSESTNDPQLSDININKQQSLTFPGQTTSQEPKMQEKPPKAVKKVIILYTDDTFHEYSADN